MRSLEELQNLWDQFGDVPLQEDTDDIDEEFLHFPIGTDRFEIWHWFEDQNHNFSVVEALQK
jgi:hypothetical protein